ncbi:MAG: lipoate--protein ligase family protein [Anaerolineae bacterium]|nr:lipoate--protein ligase family protein [Anaerolineae bacterium]
MRQWRLIYDSPTVGALNMAVDEAILEDVSAGTQPPTLRLYAWNPPCLSLGYGQRVADVDFERIAALGWDVVRRPTGGRAILHTDELTYSLSLPADDPIAAGSIVESYRRISAALIKGLESLGVQPQADKRAERGEAGGPVCFETPSHYEITVNGRKLIGSAQMRRKAGVLQHGSLPLLGDLGRICDGLIYPDQAEREMGKAQVRVRAITLAGVLMGEGLRLSPANNQVDWEMAAQAVVEGFSQTFEIDFQQQGLSDSEQIRAQNLYEQVYGTSAWTRRR